LLSHVSITTAPPLLGRLGPEYEKFGVEINSAAATIAAERFKLTVWSELREIPIDSRFDAILAIDVVEHMSSPRQFIESLLQKLSTNGLLILTTGDADNPWWTRLGARWWYCYFPEHISFISTRWLQYHSNRLGTTIMEAVRFRYKRRSLNWLLRASLLAYAAFPTLHSKIAKAINKARGHEGEVNPPGVGVSKDHLFVVLAKA